MDKPKGLFRTLLAPVTIGRKHLPFLRCLFCLMLVVCALFGAADTALASITTVEIEVQHAKANSEPWDFLNGAPDIGVCLSNETYGTVCFPDGSTMSSIREAECPDSYKCRFSVDVPEDADFKIYVVDVDLAFNDPIGTGLCHTDMTCDVGEAKVTVKKSKKSNGGWWN